MKTYQDGILTAILLATAFVAGSLHGGNKIALEERPKVAEAQVVLKMGGGGVICAVNDPDRSNECKNLLREAISLGFNLAE